MKQQIVISPDSDGQIFYTTAEISEFLKKNHYQEALVKELTCKKPEDIPSIRKKFENMNSPKEPKWYLVLDSDERDFLKSLLGSSTQENFILRQCILKKLDKMK